MESAEQVWPVLDRWLAEQAASDNWFLHVNFWDPHTPYRAPLSAGDPFANDPLPAWLDDEDLIHRHNQLVGPHSSMDINGYDDREDPRYPRHPGKVTDRPSLRRLIDGYDSGVRHADEYVGRIMARLAAAGVLEETAIIVSADHGENLGELGIYAEHGTADAITCHVPLIIAWPGGRRGTTHTGLQYNLDLAPTLMDLLGRQPCPIWDGQSFAAAITGDKPAAPGREELILSQCAHVAQRAVRFGPWLYLRTYHDGFRLLPRELLFDLSADPHEQHDLAAQRPDICHEGAWRLERWHDGQMQRMAQINPANVVDPLWTVVAEGGPLHALHAPGRSPLPAYLKRLEATGRTAGAALLRQKYAAHLPQSPA
jgi:arylsulfatase A-like enzyme